MDKKRKIVRNRTLFKKTITYTSKIITDEDGDKFPVHRKKEVNASFIRVYDGTFSLLANISKCANSLIWFCAEEMDSLGIIRNDAPTKKLFKDVVEDYTDGRTTYAEASINMAFTELVKIGLLITKGRGVFKINPEYIYRNSDANRLDVIREELEALDEKTYIELNKDLKNEI